MDTQQYLRINESRSIRAAFYLTYLNLEYPNHLIKAHSLVQLHCQSNGDLTFKHSSSVYVKLFGHANLAPQHYFFLRSVNPAIEVSLTYLAITKSASSLSCPNRESIESPLTITKSGGSAMS